MTRTERIDRAIAVAGAAVRALGPAWDAYVLSPARRTRTATTADTVGQ